MTVEEFKGAYRFMSNFYPSPIMVGEIVYPTVEHYYQASKAEWIEDHLGIAECESPGDAKMLGRQIELRSDWEDIKEKVMFTGVMLKFLTHESLQKKLLATGDAYLVEGNHWGDRVWGKTRDNNLGWVGENKLGNILMDVRRTIKEMS